MPQYYFNIETYSPGDKPDPDSDTIITIQYQRIDFRSGKPLRDIVILKEWETSEEHMVVQFYDKFFRGGQNKWIFIPVGYNLNNIWEYIIAKFKKYIGKDFSSRDFHYKIPHIDLESIIVLLNGGNFIGAKLEKFAKIPTDGGMMKQWYESKNYAEIEAYIKKSAESFIAFYQKVKQNINRMMETDMVSPKIPKVDEKPVEVVKPVVDGVTEIKEPPSIDAEKPGPVAPKEVPKETAKMIHEPPPVEAQREPIVLEKPPVMVTQEKKPEPAELTESKVIDKEPKASGEWKDVLVEDDEEDVGEVVEGVELDETGLEVVEEEGVEVGEIEVEGIEVEEIDEGIEVEGIEVKKETKKKKKWSLRK